MFSLDIPNIKNIVNSIYDDNVDLLSNYMGEIEDIRKNTIIDLVNIAYSFKSINSIKYFVETYLRFLENELYELKNINDEFFKLIIPLLVKKNGNLIVDDYIKLIEYKDDAIDYDGVYDTLRKNIVFINNIINESKRNIKIFDTILNSLSSNEIKILFCSDILYVWLLYNKENKNISLLKEIDKFLETTSLQVKLSFNYRLDAQYSIRKERLNHTFKYLKDKVVIDVSEIEDIENLNYWNFYNISNILNNVYFINAIGTERYNNLLIELFNKYGKNTWKIVCPSITNHTYKNLLNKDIILLDLLMKYSWEVVYKQYYPQLVNFVHGYESRNTDICLKRTPEEKSFVRDHLSHIILEYISKDDFIEYISSSDSNRSYLKNIITSYHFSTPKNYVEDIVNILGLDNYPTVLKQFTERSMTNSETSFINNIILY